MELMSGMEARVENMLSAAWDFILLLIPWTLTGLALVYVTGVGSEFWIISWILYPVAFVAISFLSKVDFFASYSRHSILLVKTLAIGILYVPVSLLGMWVYYAFSQL